MPNLSPCPSCNRHARADETECPFCKQPLCPSPCDAATPAPSRTRLGRAALLTASAATLLGVACRGVPAYGAPFPGPDGGAVTDAGNDGPASDK